MKTNVKNTSRKSHKINIDGRLYRPCEVSIVNALRSCGTPMSRTELELITGLRVNQITGRVNDLIAANVLKVAGTKKNPATGREVEEVMLA